MLFILFSVVLASVSASPLLIVSIDGFGAVPDVDSELAALKNSAAIERAMLAVNMIGVVIVPANRTYTISVARMEGLSNVVLNIQGTLVLSKLTKLYPTKDMAALTFKNCTNIGVEGNGVSTSIDGRGWVWWVRAILLLDGGQRRPKLIQFEHCEFVTVGRLVLRNSPYWHINMRDVRSVKVSHVDIIVDITSQRKLLLSHGHFHDSLGIPTFPLNTDGIDIAGTDIVVENVYIENFDDAVVAKPTHGGNQGAFSNCTERMLVRNSRVKYGVGMSVGSVPPHIHTNCIRDVAFENVTFERALKAIYIKSNPGTEGTGIIEGITYRNIHSKSTIWMPIWIGPQQQHQPGQKGTGCSFLYPIVDKCPTNPLVTIRNINLVNVTLDDSYLMPGVLLCDASNPCVGFDATHVTNNGINFLTTQYVVKNVKFEHAQKNSPPFIPT